MSLKIGKVSSCRWLNTGTIICRIWISQHGITSEDVLEKLALIMDYIIGVYYPLYFYIKVLTMSDAAHHNIDQAGVLLVVLPLLTGTGLLNQQVCHALLVLVRL